MPILECRRCRKLVSYGKLDDLPHFPFCSERCKLIDLGQWLDGDHRIPGEPPSPADESTPPPQ